MADDEIEWRELNRRWWDERVPIHVASAFYDNESFVAGRSSLRPFEVVELGPVDDRSLVHLQCHFGQDTLSWARLGARVTGLDFSEPAMVAARRLAARVGVEAEFVTSDVYDAVAALGARTFDVVYTGFGALNWLPDIGRWADVVATLVAPGGVLYLAEFHPFTTVFGDRDLTVEHTYFARDTEVFDDGAGTYTDLDAPTVNNRVCDWNHPLGEVVSAVIDAGLQVELLHEHDHTLFPRWPFLEARPDGTYHLPDGAPSLPLMYTLRARQPGAA